MTFDEACGVKNPHGLAHGEKYDRYLAHIGYDKVAGHLPFTKKELIKAYAADRNMNNLPLSKWEQAAGFPGKPDRQGEPPRMSSGSFRRLLESSGITRFSPSECVCLLKRAAERLVLAELARSADIRNMQCWAVFENWNAAPDAASKGNIFDFDCLALFDSEQDAIAFEMENPAHRVRKLIRDARPAKKGDERE